MSYVTLLHLPFFSIFYFQNKLILKLFYSIKICLRMCLRDLHEKNEHIETALEFTQNRKNNRERELYKSISSFLVSLFSAPTHPPSIHTLWVPRNTYHFTLVFFSPSFSTNNQICFTSSKQSWGFKQKYTIIKLILTKKNKT